MSLPPADICSKDEKTEYFPVENTEPEVGYCLCPKGSGIFDYNKDNTGTHKCSLDVKYNGVSWSEDTNNQPLVQHNYVYAEECMEGYTPVKTNIKNALKCESTKCPPGWKETSDGNCEFIDKANKKHVVDMKTIGYIAVKPGSKDYNISLKNIYTSNLYEIPKRNYKRIYDILKIIGLIILGLILLGLLIFLLKKLFFGKSKEEVGTSLEEAPVIEAPYEPEFEKPSVQEFETTYEPEFETAYEPEFETTYKPEFEKPSAPVIEAPSVEVAPSAPVIEAPIKKEGNFITNLFRKKETPVMETPPSAPVMETPPSAPVIEATPSAPVMESQPSAPVMETPLKKEGNFITNLFSKKEAPVMETPPSAPVMETQQSAPVMEASPVKPVMETPSKNTIFLNDLNNNLGDMKQKTTI